MAKELIGKTGIVNTTTMNPETDKPESKKYGFKLYTNDEQKYYQCLNKMGALYNCGAYNVWVIEKYYFS